MLGAGLELEQLAHQPRADDGRAQRQRAGIVGRVVHEHRRQPRHVEHGADRPRRAHDHQRAVNRLEPLVELDEHADARRADKRHVGQVEPQLVMALAHRVGQPGIEVLGPIAVEPPDDGQLGPAFHGAPGDFHVVVSEGPTTSSAFATRSGGMVRPMRRAADGFTISRVLPTA